MDGLREKIAAKIAHMPKEAQTLLALWYYEELTTLEIAHVLEWEEERVVAELLKAIRDVQGEVPVMVTPKLYVLDNKNVEAFETVEVLLVDGPLDGVVYRFSFDASLEVKVSSLRVPEPIPLDDLNDGRLRYWDYRPMAPGDDIWQGRVLR